MSWHVGHVSDLVFIHFRCGKCGVDNLSFKWQFMSWHVGHVSDHVFIHFRCAKCGVDNPSFKWRFMLSLLISDSTDCLWITSFQETSQSVLGVDADTLGRWQVCQKLSIMGRPCLTTNKNWVICLSNCPIVVLAPRLCSQNPTTLFRRLSLDLNILMWGLKQRAKDYAI